MGKNPKGPTQSDNVRTFVIGRAGGAELVRSRAEPPKPDRTANADQSDQTVLGATAEALNVVLNRAQDALREMKAGVTAYVVLDDLENLPENEYEAFHPPQRSLVFAKRHGEWTLLVSVGRDIENGVAGEESSLFAGSLETRRKAAEKMPFLFKAVREAQRKHVDSTITVIERLADFLAEARASSANIDQVIERHTRESGE
jgi:hypothetical protein